jgi:D-beta-D-heptose 7-phosphate kinase/D-beta-D-heptose 1-phosphate adenosyltransferase
MLVVGDAMLDDYVFGQIERISPEAPIPVFRKGKTRRVPGGAANVAANLAALGARVELLAVVGDDEAGAVLRGLLAASDRIDPTLLIAAGRPTTVKTRYAAAAQQVLRVDSETDDALPDAIEARLLDHFAQAIDAVQAVILSDYGKGVLSPRSISTAIELARAARKTVIVDPKKKDAWVYRGATILKPNVAELAAMTGATCDTPQRIAAAAWTLSELTGAEILLTRSSRGISYFGRNAGDLHLPAAAQEVFDVSGAGDTVVAAFSAATAIGQPPLAAMRLANVAAGIVVRRFGTSVVTAEELEAEVRAARPAASIAGALSLAEAAQACESWRRAGLTIGFTNGCFDILHAGHVSLLSQARAACDRLVVGLNSDSSVRALKGEARPIQCEESRAIVLGALQSVDAVVLFDQPTPIELIEVLRPDILVKGADYREDEVVGADFVKSIGGRVVLADLVDGHSTTRIVLSIRSND